MVISQTEFVPGLSSMDQTPSRRDGDHRDPGPLRAYLWRVAQLLDQRIADVQRNWLVAPMHASAGDDADPAGSEGATTGPGRPGLAGSIDFADLLSELISSGGKRMRPTLCFLGFWAAGGRPGAPAEQRVINIGAALELLHTFALIHDDVMDESSRRRGLPTVQVRLAQQHAQAAGWGEARRFGENMATLLGDLAHAEADTLIAECPADVRARWQTMIIDLIRGQFQDLAGAADRSQDVEQALLVARLKSGGYTIQRPLELGATAAQASPKLVDRLSAFGREIGAAFALRDDILGVWGDPQVTGKPAGDDLLSGKPTVIIAMAQRRLPADAQQLLDRLGSDAADPGDVAIVQQAIRDCGIRAEVEKMITRHVERGLELLDPPAFARSRTTPPNDVTTQEPVAALVRIAHQAAWRDR
jgi:geranylgeranyl diphosphate synthase type I